MPRQRKAPQTLAEEEGDDESKKGFFACYLLVSLSPRHKGHTYIGFTVNPRRRIRQHNGEIGCGAWRTKKRRPWEMVLCIHGFPSNVSALQFEWAWQHPNESLAVRKAAASFKSLSGPANKIKLAYTMLALPSWQSLNLTVNYFSTKYVSHSAGCSSLPGLMKVRVSGMDELPCYVEGLSEDEFDCDIVASCEETLSSSVFGNSEECDKSGFGDGREDHSEGRGFFESPERPSSPKTLLGSLMNEEEAGLDSFGLKRLTRAPEEVDVEIVDLTLPSPLCEAGLCGQKVKVSPMDELPCYVESSSEGGFDGDIAKYCEETSSSYVFGNLEECDKGGFDKGRGLFESPERPSSSKACLDSSMNEEEAGLSGFGLKRPTTAPEEVAIEVVDLTTPSPLCGAGLWGKKGQVFPKIINLTNSPLYV